MFLPPAEAHVNFRGPLRLRAFGNRVGNGTGPRDLRHLEHEIIHPKLGIQEIATLRDKFSSAAVGRIIC